MQVLQRGDICSFTQGPPALRDQRSFLALYLDTYFITLSNVLLWIHVWMLAIVHSHRSFLYLIFVIFGLSLHAKTLYLRGCDEVRHQPQPSYYWASNLCLYRTPHVRKWKSTAAWRSLCGIHQKIRLLCAFLPTPCTST